MFYFENCKTVFCYSNCKTIFSIKTKKDDFLLKLFYQICKRADIYTPPQFTICPKLLFHGIYLIWPFFLYFGPIFPNVKVYFSQKPYNLHDHFILPNPNPPPPPSNFFFFLLPKMVKSHFLTQRFLGSEAKLNSIRKTWSFEGKSKLFFVDRFLVLK